MSACADAHTDIFSSYCDSPIGTIQAIPGLAEVRKAAGAKFNAPTAFLFVIKEPFDVQLCYF